MRFRRPPVDLVDAVDGAGTAALSGGLVSRLSVCDGSQATYQMSYLLADYLIAREGFGSLVDYFRSFARRADRRANFQTAFGQPLREFEQEAVVHLAKFRQ